MVETVYNNLISSQQLYSFLGPYLISFFFIVFTPIIKQHAALLFFT